MTVLSASGLEELEEECNNLKKECKSLREECAKLREKIKDLELSEHSFKDDDNKVRYYIGLPCFSTLMTISTLLLHTSERQDELPYPS